MRDTPFLLKRFGSSSPYGLPNSNLGYCRGVEDLRRDLPATDEVEVPSEVLAGINRGIKDADQGRSVSLEEAIEMIPKWISKFESQKRR
jgi:hypothetical protein